MLTLSRRPPDKPSAGRPVSLRPVHGPHRQRFTIEVAFFYTPSELDDCLACPVSGRRVVLYGGRGPLPPALAERTGRVVRLAGVDPLEAAVLAHAGLRDGDTLTVLLPADWDGPPAETLLDHARRWFASPHSGEDEQVG
jgi:hypothetical protein